MKTTQTTNQPAEPEAEPTMRALDPFFETRDMRDHANQWDVSAMWTTRQVPSTEKERGQKAESTKQ
jgi:hypothetical protein